MNIYDWSRIANVKTTVETMRENFLSTTIKNKAIDKMDMTAEAMLKSLDLEKLINKLEEFGLKTSTVITVDNYLLLEDFLIQNWDEVIDAYAPYEMATKEY